MDENIYDSAIKFLQGTKKTPPAKEKVERFLKVYSFYVASNPYKFN